MDWARLPLRNAALRLFISYRSHNRLVAEYLESFMLAAGHHVWRDRKDLYVGDSWRDEIRTAIADCDEVVVLLTAEAVQPPSGRNAENQVLAEVDVALDLNKRILCFASVDVREHAPFHRRLQHVNYDAMPQRVAEDLYTRPRQAAAYVGGRIVQQARPAHPATLRDFERTAARHVYPEFDAIAPGGGPRGELLSTYSAHATHLAREPTRLGPMLWLNLGLLEAHRERWANAQASLDRSIEMSPLPLAMYYQACILLTRRRPRHLRSRLQDRCVDLLRSAIGQLPSPLATIALLSVLWDTGRGRGPQAGRLFRQAVRALRTIDEEPGEIRRLLWFLPLDAGIALPMDATELQSELLGASEGNE